MMPRQFNYDGDFRKRQIDTLKIFNDKVVEVQENEEYSIQFDSAGRVFVLTAYLGANFPNEKPRLVVAPAVQHHWVNASGEVENAPGFLNYSPHSDLGRVVQAIIREFEKFPPSLVDAPPASVQDGSAVDAAVPSKLNESYSHNNAINLSTLSLDELKKLDTDPEFFDDFIEEMSVVQALNDELDTMINQVELISRENETKEAHLTELKAKLTQDVTALQELGEKCEKLNQKYLKKSDELEPQHIKELLQIATSNADTECDKHVEHFLNGKIDVQTFLNNYTLSKRISSERKAKEERLTHQLSALENAGI